MNDIEHRVIERARNITCAEWVDLTCDQDLVDGDMISEASSWPLVPNIINLCWQASQGDNDDPLEFFDRLLGLMEAQAEKNNSPKASALRELFDSPEMRRLAGVAE